MSRAFTFPGQGSQSIGMGKPLAEAFSAAREVFEEVDDALGQKLSTLMWEGEAEDLTLTENAQPALMATSMAAMAAMKQNKFMEFHNAMMKNRRSLNEELVLQIARDAGLDEATLIQDMADPVIEANIMRTKYLVQNIGISGTPGFVIGDRIMPGFRSYDELKDVITQVRETRQM